MWYNICNFLSGFFFALCAMLFIVSVILTITCGLRLVAGGELFWYHYAASFGVAAGVGLYHAIVEY